MNNFQQKANAPTQAQYEQVLNCVIYQSYSVFVNDLKLVDRIDISIDIYIVKVIIDRCLRDFRRLKNHHNIDRVSSSKMAGYLNYWICKLLPLKVHNDRLYDQDKNYYLNQTFALMCGITLINQEKRIRRIENLDTGMNNTDIKITDLYAIFMDLIYTLKYCELNPDLLSMIYFYADFNGGKQLPNYFITAV